MQTGWFCVLLLTKKDQPRTKAKEMKAKTIVDITNNFRNI